MKEKLKRFLASLAAVILAVGMMAGVSGVPVRAANTGTITINPPTGTASNTQTQYKVYKVFDATVNNSSVSYTLLSGKSTSDTAWTSSNMGTYFSVSAGGNVTALAAAKDSSNSSALSSGAVTAIAAYVDALKLRNC